jgi:hypothetical protein
MDLQFWLYVIIGVIYLLSRVLKSKAPEAPENTAQPTPRSPREQQTDRPRQLTFEELLKEITEAKQPQKPVFQPETVREVVDYDDELVEEEQDLETLEPEYTKKEGSRSYQSYEDAKREAFVRPSLEETMNVRDTVIQFGKFKEFERNEQSNVLAEYTKQFQDPEGLKKAVVLSEILNRRFQY